jgi:membrane protease YdiL (CAAX protease family)
MPEKSMTTTRTVTLSHSTTVFIGGASPLAQVPILAGLVVFAPILLTILSGRLLSPFAVYWSAVFPAYRFLLYAIWNGITIGCLYRILRQYGVTWGDLGWSHFRWRDQALALTAAIIGLFVLFPLANGLAAWLGLPLSQTEALLLNNPLNWVSAILLPSLLIPIAEEILFRGYLLGLLSAKFVRPWAVGLIGTAMFAGMHIGLYGLSQMLVVVSLWTILPVGLFIWRRSIYPTGTLHILNNLFGFVIIPWLLR